jgi:hypothetical protein
MELNLKYIKVGHKRTVILQDEANWCTSQKVIAEKAWPTFTLPSPFMMRIKYVLSNQVFIHIFS